jgi:hypothetical protein
MLPKIVEKNWKIKTNNAIVLRKQRPPLTFISKNLFDFGGFSYEQDC